MKSDRLVWYLLIHQLPPKPLYLRAKIRQKLARAGAVALKNSVYVLPRREECRAAFAAIASDATDGGGDAYVCEASFVATDAERIVVDRFRSERDEDYRALAGRLEAGSADAKTLARVAKRLEEIARINYFDSPAGADLERKVAQMRAAVRRRRSAPAGGRTWFTRRGVHIDRIASAWLIRRFLDPEARFRFGDAAEPRSEGEVSFDVPGGDFSHEEDWCTFETLVKRHGLADPALRQVAEIVHDVDVQDGKFGRPESAGVARVIAGILAGHPGDSARLERGSAFFEDLYRSFEKPVATPAGKDAKRAKGKR